MEKIISSLQQKYSLPAIAAAIVTSNGIIEINVIGIRKNGSDITVTIDDRWHLGSCTKPLTSTLIAALIDRGELAWETTIGDIFPTINAIDKNFSKINLLH